MRAVSADMRWYGGYRLGHGLFAGDHVLGVGDVTVLTGDDWVFTVVVCSQSVMMVQWRNGRSGAEPFYGVVVSHDCREDTQVFQDVREVVSALEYLTPVPEGVRAFTLTDFVFLQNFSGSEKLIRLPGNMTDLISGNEIEGAFSLPLNGIIMLKKS